MLEAKNISVIKNEKCLLSIDHFQLAPGELVILLGPNGAGKSTFMQALSGTLHEKNGQVCLAQIPLVKWDSNVRAQRLAVLPQINQINFPISVAEVVALGRTPYKTTFHENAEIVASCLHDVDLLSAESRAYTELSGGEQQRVQIARVLAQLTANTSESRFLLLDEPLSALDLAHQLQTMQLLRTKLQANWGILAVIHDLNLAMQYADRIIMLHQGKIKVNAPPMQALTAEHIRDVFAIEALCSAQMGTEDLPVIVPIYHRSA